MTSTRIWKDRQLVGKDHIAPEQEVHVNLTWGPFESLATTDVWLDQESLEACREIQRQRHLRLIRSRFLPGWVDAVKNWDTGGGEITVTLFGGMDPLLYKELKQTKRPADLRCRELPADVGLSCRVCRSWEPSGME